MREIKVGQKVVFLDSPPPEYRGEIYDVVREYKNGTILLKPTNSSMSLSTSTSVDGTSLRIMYTLHQS